MNKYQEALDKIKSYTNIIIDKGENYTLVKNQVPKECFDTLQELIDKEDASFTYDELSNKVCRLEEELKLYITAFDIICFDYVNAFWGTRSQNEIKKRFLDKALAELSKSGLYDTNKNKGKNSY